MPIIPDSPESRQIDDVAINEEETIIRRPPLEGGTPSDSAGGGDAPEYGD